MSINILGYAALNVNATLEPYQFTRRELRADDVLIDILYCGVCHSDIHQVNNDWSNTIYPLVPGHEIVGRVISVGGNVTRFKTDDVVGVGCMVDACQHCDPCKRGLEQYCEGGFTPTYNGYDRQDHNVTYGGYSEKIVVSERFVLTIPQGLDLKGVAPLLCAGITTWSPLQHWHVKQGSKVAIVGLGGLGHMAIKLAKGLGAEVTLFTRSPSKESEALRLGADHVILSTDKQQMQAINNHFELIIDTVPYEHDLNSYIPTLSLDGTLVLVGLIGNVEPALNTVPMVFGRKAVVGSVIGGIVETQKMLDFCSKQGITADVEIIDIQQTDEAYQRMLKSDVKYRFVIDMASLNNKPPTR